MSGQNYLEAERLTVGYDRKPLIEEISLAVRRGEIVTLIGPNGAGKSTILKSIARLLAPISGSVFLDGQSMKNLPGKEIAEKMSFLFQDRFHPRYLSCYEVVAAGRYPYTGLMNRLEENDRRVIRESMEQVEISDLKDRPFTGISDGQKQRVLLARAIAQEPELIVLDEPTSYLDIRHKLLFLSVLRRLAKEKKIAVLMSLHELDLVSKISDLVVCVHGNRIEKTGRPEDILTSEYVSHLYELGGGSFDPAAGSVHFPVPFGTPRAFVIAGGGSGIPVFRRLEREAVPFSTGILHENDADYTEAGYTAVEVIAEKAYTDISPETEKRAVEAMLRADYVLCPLRVFGRLNEANKRLKELAEEKGMLESLA